MYNELEDEEARRARRRLLIEKGKRRNQRRKMIYDFIRRYGVWAGGVLLIGGLVFAGGRLLNGNEGDTEVGKGVEKGIESNISKEAEREIEAGQEAMEASEVIRTIGATGMLAAATGELQQVKNAPGVQVGENTAMQAEGTVGTEVGMAEAAGVSETAIGASEAVAGVAGNSVGFSVAEQQPVKQYFAQTTENTLQLGAEIDSSYAIFIDLETGNILAQKDAKTIINPASMTKVLTVLVAAEHVENLDDTFTITLNETDYSYVNDCSSVGFLENEVVTVRDLFYGTILPSGGDAAAALATYVAGSREAFVDMMNAKLEELGLSDTAHMTNCVGLYDEEHYCTAYDMAMVMEAAMDNELCREVMSARIYTTSATEQHPEGIQISNWFIRRIEDKDTGGEVLCAKTGYVVQSGSCAASYGKDAAGREYVCVTGDAGSSWKCIYDHVALYKQFTEQ